MSLPSSTNTYQLTGLKPGTKYRITLYTLYDGGEVATPVTTFQTGECFCGSPELSPTIPSLWHGGLSHWALLSLRTALAMRPLSCLVTAQDEYGGRAVQAVPLQVCLTCSLTGVEAPVAAVSDLRLVEESGRRPRLSWTSVPGATEYKVIVRNNQGESCGQVLGWHLGAPDQLTLSKCTAPLLADGTERTRHIPGSETGLDLGDLEEGITYLVRVSALAGSQEGNAATLTIRLSKSTSGFGARSSGTACSHSGLHLSPIPLQPLGVAAWLWGPFGLPKVTLWCCGVVQSIQRWAAFRSCG